MMLHEHVAQTCDCIMNESDFMSLQLKFLRAFLFADVLFWIIGNVFEMSNHDAFRGFINAAPLIYIITLIFYSLVLFVLCLNYNEFFDWNCRFSRRRFCLWGFFQILVIIAYGLRLYFFTPIKNPFDIISFTRNIPSKFTYKYIEYMFEGSILFDSYSVCWHRNFFMDTISLHERVHRFRTYRVIRTVHPPRPLPLYSVRFVRI